MDAPPLALLRLREGEIVRLCGLVRAARGQEAARQGKITQAARTAGTLRATMLEGETSRVVAAHFSDAGLDGWECSCPVFAEQRAVPHAESAAGASPAELSLEPVRASLFPSFACEHVAALLWSWLLDPRQFQMEGGKPAPAFMAATPVLQPAALLAAASSAPSEAAQPGLSPASAVAPPAPAALELLSPAARRLLGLLALAGGRVTDEEGQRLFARMGLGPIEAAPQALKHLQEAGWLERQQPEGWGRSRPLTAAGPQSWAIPAALLGQVPREVALEEMPAGDALTIAPAAGERLPEQLVLALALALAHPTPADLPQHLQARLGVPGEQARFLLGLLYQAGLVSREQAGLASRAPGASSQEQTSVNSGGAAGETLLRGARFLLWREAQEVARDLLTLWQHARPARELADLREVGVRVATLPRHERQAAGEIAAENQAAKALVLDLLGAVPAGRWWSFGSWVEFVWRFRPEFLRGRRPALLRPVWWLERIEDGAALAADVRAQWRQGEGRYLALLFRRALHWLGLLDLAFDAGGRLKGFRITARGALLLKKAPTADQQLAGADQQPAAANQRTQAATVPRKKKKKRLPLQALGDERLVVPLAALREAEAEALETVLCWCEPAGATAEGLLVLPTARRVAAGLDAQHDLEAWLAGLESGLPASPEISALVARVRGWAAAYGRVRLYPAVALLEVADAALMRELERTVHLAKRRDHQLSPEMAVIGPGEVEALVEELRRRGYFPWIVPDETAY